MSIICPGPSGASGLTFESSATAGDRTATINTFNRVDATAGDVFITLPASGNAGDRVAVSNEVSSNIVFVNPDTGDSIDGVVDGTFRLRPGEVATWYWDGASAWTRESRSFLDIINFATATGTYLDAPSSTRLDFYINDASKFALTNSFIEIGIAFQPDTTDIRDIGTAALKFRDLYLSGDVGSLAAPIDGLCLAQAGTGLVLDTDGDSLISATADDVVEIEAGPTSKIALIGSGNTLTLTLGSLARYVADTGTLRPATAGAVDLGALAVPWGALRLDEAGDGLVLDGDGDTKLCATADDTWRLQRGAATTYIQGSAADDFQVVIANSTAFAVNTSRLRVNGAGNQDFAETGRRIRDVYLRGGIAREDRGGAPTPAVGDVYVRALDNAGTLEYRAAFNGADYLVVDENGLSDLGAFGGKDETLGVGFKLFLDSDSDTFLRAPLDDQFELQVGSANNAFDWDLSDWRMFCLTTFSGKTQVLSAGFSDCFLASITNLEGSDVQVKAVEGVPSTISSSSHRVVLGGHTEPSNSVFDLGQDGAEWKRLWLSEEIVLGDDTGAPSGEASRVKIYASDTNADQMELRAAFPAADVKLGPYLELARFIAEDSFEEVTYSGGKVAAVTVWTDNGKTTKIRDTVFTYSGVNVSTAVTKHYDDSGVVITGETMTETYTYSGAEINSIDRVLT